MFETRVCISILELQLMCFWLWQSHLYLISTICLISGIGRPGWGGLEETGEHWRKIFRHRLWVWCYITVFLETVTTGTIGLVHMQNTDKNSFYHTSYHCTLMFSVKNCNKAHSLENKSLFVKILSCWWAALLHTLPYLHSEFLVLLCIYFS